MGRRMNGFINEDKPYKLFFICGHGKSGTNWVSALLNLHPAIYVRGEFHFQYLMQGFKKFMEMDHLLVQHEPFRSTAQRSIEDLIRRTILQLRREKPDAVYLGDQSPRPLEVFLPRCPHFYVLRDGRDVLISFSYHVLRTQRPTEVPSEFQAFAMKLAKDFHEDPDHRREAAEALLANENFVRWFVTRWRRWIKKDMRTISKLREKSTITPVFTIRYEDLHRDVEGKREEMYRFLGTDPSEAAPLDKNTRPGRKIEDPMSLFRKGIVGDWQNYMTNNLRRWIKACAGDLLIELGYAEDMNW
jgi:hypothetical protein